MRSALQRVGAALAGALIATSVVAAPASAEPATLSGTVVDDATGAAVPACVIVYDTSYSYIDQACTDELGAWSVTTTESGVAYKVEIQPYDGVHLPEWATDADGFDSAAEVVAPATVAARVAEGAVVTGHLTRSDGSPADGTSVSLWPENAAAATGFAYVSDGTWRALVAPGSYQVEFSNQPFHQWATGAADRGAATVFTAAAGADTTVDDVLTVEEAVSLEGTITDARTGAPLDGCVTAYVAETYDYASSACTGWEDGTTGQWKIYGLPVGVGYKVEVSSYDGIHLGEWAQDASDFGTADEYVTPATVDVALATGSSLTGTLRGTDGQPVSDGYVYIEPDDGSPSLYASIEMDGTWRSVVAPGAYRVELSSGGADQWAVGASTRDEATVFTVGEGETVDASDQLLPGAQVSGTVTSTTGAPVEGACVDVIRMPVVDWPETAGQACTDASGHYEADLWGGGGTFTARISDPEGRFVQEYYDDKAALTAADTFSVVRGRPTIVDAALAKSATITGLAVDAKLGTPLAGACPDAYVGHAGARVDGQVATCSDATGRWTVSGLPAGSYAVHLGMGHGPYPSGDVWAFKATSQATADLVTVKAGATKTIRNVKIDPPVTISGRITDPFGNPVEGATVNPRGQLLDRSGECFDCATTDADGRYTLGLIAAGTYRPVVYTGYFSSGTWAPEWSGNSTTYEGATPITIKAGRSAAFSAQLAPASTISGELVNADGSPAGEGWIGFIESSTGAHMGDFDVFGGNTFRPVTLPAGDFRIHLENAYTGEEAWYDSSSTESGATVVTLREGENRYLTIHLPASAR
ncbi:carboxypeptidase-like regulatory domain-containing protein [Terrabacter sp. Root85]|uniref:carboxypeptidase-like regulatory domain-containing protein n=1 Tax=Terrabacter sp. Root85 TaxID=1736603 RepID=UPI000AED26B7|nr:carboxypeptidase-like regulatory domain-containing protein [Terrabacter sp. Root85]